MSVWSYVRGCVWVQVPGRTQCECDYVIKSVLNHLPLVSGSESDTYLQPVEANVDLHFSRFDDFGRPSNILINNKETNFHSRSGSFVVCNTYAIVVSGNLRDRSFEETVRNTEKLIVRLGKRLYVQHLHVLVYGDTGQSFSFSQSSELGKDWVSQLYNPDESKVRLKYLI